MIFLILIPVSIGMGLAGLAAFFWALRSDQFSDLDGAAWRVILHHREGQQGAHHPVGESEQSFAAKERRRSPAPEQT